ncbi:glycosyl hydrolase 5 family protein-like [Eucalyptus grandis]|uniref:glycosyl hydrolase 5 family protein-like n=1 Tax=Eucalyptus grandis TaxID=71139 RepID=UPI00192EDC0F|nr:glycosyl hydrolase 5 family protein-like [Eucalyptus grandis]
MSSAARDWYQYIRTAATKVHRANPNVLVILSGLTWASISASCGRGPWASLGPQTGPESHRYSFRGDRKIWEVQPVDRVCTTPGRGWTTKLGSSRAAPARPAVPRPEKTFGVVDFNWDGLRNPKFGERFQQVQTTIQGVEPLPRRRPDQVDGHSSLPQALGDGLPPALSNDCSSQRSAWRSISNSKLHVAATDEHGNRLCWEKKSNESSLVLTRKCICVDDDSGCMENPQGQWFKFVPTNT